MAKKVEIELDIKSNVGQSMADLKALKKQLKDTAAGSEEFKKLYNQIDDLEDKIKGAKKGSADWIDSLESAGGPLGMLGAGLNKAKVATQSFGGALKATGIGLIVGLIGGLVAAFSQTEGSMKKLEPLLIAMEQIFGGIMGAVQPLIDGFIELAIQVMPYVTKAFKVVYSAVTAVFQSLGKVGSAIVKLFKGDFKGAWADAKESVTGFSDNYDDAVDRFEKGAAKTTKTQKKNAEDAKAIADKALAEKLKHMEAEDKIDEATLEKMKAEAMALATTEQQKLDIETAFAKKSYNLKKQDLLDKQALYKKDSDEYKAYAAELIKLEGDYINNKTANEQKQRDLDIAKRKDYFEKDKATFQSQMDERQRNIDTANETELQALDLKLKSGQIKEFEYQQELYKLKQQQLSKGLEQLNFAEQQEKMHYENLYNRGKINKEDYETALLDIQKRYGDKRVQNLKEQGVNEFNEAVILAQKLVETKQFEKDAIIALEEAKINAIATLGNIISQLANGNKELAILGLAVQQGAAIAEILTKFWRTKAELISAGALYKAMIPNPITAAIGIAGQAAVTAAQTANTIGMVAGLAGVAASAAQGISSINKGGATSGAGKADAGPGIQNKPGYGDGGLIDGPLHAAGGVMINAEGGEAVMTRGAVTMFGPLLSQLNQAGGGTSFSKGATGQANYDAPQQQAQTQILRTYVVENELTSIQHKQARLKDLSTL